MRFGYTVSLDLDGRRCVVFGGGPLAAQRADDLLRAGSRVDVVTPRPGEGVRALAAAGRVTLHARGFVDGDLDGAFLAISTREDEQPVEPIWTAARHQRVLFNAADDVEHCDFAAVATVRRGDLTVTVSSAGRAPALVRRIRQQLEGILPPELSDLVDVVDQARRTLGPRSIDFATWSARWSEALADLDGLVAAVRAGARGAVHDRITATVRDGNPPEPASAAPPRSGTSGTAHGAAAPGHVYLVGGGPGAAGLLTLRGAELLASCDLVAYDRLAPRGALDLVPPGAERLCVGKTPGQPGWTQEEIDALLVSEARSGRSVVRLKGGDPFVFGRGFEELAACRRAGVPVEVVPGVTSAVAAPAAANIPVTHRGLAPGVAIVAGHEDPAKPHAQVDLEALARFPGTLVFLMGVAALPRITASLIRAGRPATTPVAVVSRATTPDETVVTGSLATIADHVATAGIAAPATIVVGDVVSLRETLEPVPAATASG